MTNKALLKLIFTNEASLDINNTYDYYSGVDFDTDY